MGVLNFSLVIGFMRPKFLRINSSNILSRCQNGSLFQISHNKASHNKVPYLEEIHVSSIPVKISEHIFSYVPVDTCLAFNIYKLVTVKVEC